MTASDRPASMKRLAAAIVSALAATAVLAASAPASQSGRHEGKPTIVLVHGA
jgi:hypothetical protein